MHLEVLSKQQQALLPLLKQFSQSFVLVGGTAIALHLGHRKSIDFDLFTKTKFDSLKIRSIISRKNSIQQTMVDSQYELTILVDGVKLTFYQYPFFLSGELQIRDSVSIPALAILAAMKAFALGRRAKWKDYVDLFFIINKLGYEKVISTAKELFANEFNEKLFRSQLSYFKDIDYSEKIDYLIQKPPTDKKIKTTLVKIGTA